MKTIFKSLILGTAVLFMPAAASAGLISASEDFSGGSSGDWTSAWNLATGNSIAAGSLNLTGNQNGAAVRGIETVSAGMHHTVRVSFDFSFSGTAGSNTFLGFWMGSSDPSSGPNFGVKSGQNAAGDFFGRRGGTSGTYGFGTLAENTLYSMTAELTDSDNNGAWDSLRFRVNGGTWVTATSGTVPGSFTSFSQVGFRTANVGGNEFAINNLSVSAIPEPTSILLVGSVLGLVGLKRRRR